MCRLCLLEKLSDALTCCGFGVAPAFDILIQVACNVCSSLHYYCGTPEIEQELHFSHSVLHLLGELRVYCSPTAKGQLEKSKTESGTAKAKKEVWEKDLKASFHLNPEVSHAVQRVALGCKRCKSQSGFILIWRR